MSDELIVRDSGPLTQFMPQDGRGLMILAEQVAASGFFTNRGASLTKAQAFVIMCKGAELGLSPLQSMEHISIINGRPNVSGAVMSAKMQPYVETWKVDSSDKHCTITFKRRGFDEEILSVSIDDIPKRYFQASRSGEPSNWTLIPEDMLFWWTVRRIARRYFPDALVALGDAVRDEPREVIDVRAVERETRNDTGEYGRCSTCGETLYLTAAKSGGAFLSCSNGHTSPPPKEVRDTLRGRTKEFTQPSDKTEPKQASEPTSENDPHPKSEPTLENDPDPPSEPTAEKETILESEPPTTIAPNSTSALDEEARARKTWTQEITAVLKQHMDNGRPSASHAFVLASHGWAEDEKVMHFLQKLPFAELEKLRHEVMITKS